MARVVSHRHLSINLDFSNPNGWRSLSEWSGTELIATGLQSNADQSQISHQSVLDQLPTNPQPISTWSSMAVANGFFPTMTFFLCALVMSRLVTDVVFLVVVFVLASDPKPSATGVLSRSVHCEYTVQLL